MFRCIRQKHLTKIEEIYKQNIYIGLEIEKIMFVPVRIEVYLIVADIFIIFHFMTSQIAVIHLTPK